MAIAEAASKIRLATEHCRIIGNISSVVSDTNADQILNIDGAKSSSSKGLADAVANGARRSLATELKTLAVDLCESGCDADIHNFLTFIANKLDKGERLTSKEKHTLTGLLSKMSDKDQIEIIPDEEYKQDKAIKQSIDTVFDTLLEILPSWASGSGFIPDKDDLADSNVRRCIAKLIKTGEELTDKDTAGLTETQRNTLSVSEKVIWAAGKSPTGLFGWIGSAASAIRLTPMALQFFLNLPILNLFHGTVGSYLIAAMEWAGNPDGLQAMQNAIKKCRGEEVEEPEETKTKTRERASRSEEAAT